MSPAELTWHATAASNLLEARKKNGRLGSRKSRSGCTTCKIRRVKCDEAKPECHRCISTGRRCDGYPADPSPRLKKITNSLIGSQLSQSLGLRDGDRRTFDFFLSWTAPRLGGSLDKEFWCGHVLQIAQAEPVILDSLLAISTLYEHPQYMASFRGNSSNDALTPGSGKIPAVQTAIHIVPPPLDEYHTQALQLYNRAIRGFKERIQEGKATPLLALLSCVLFVCIEIIRDNVFAALSLFIRSTDLLKQCEAEVTDNKHQGLLTLIKLMFARLGVLAATFGHPHPMDVPLEFVIAGQHTVFANMAEARTALFALMADSHAFLVDANDWKESLVTSEGANLRSCDTAHDGTKVGTLDAFVQPSISETGRAVLPATINLRTGDGVTRYYYGGVDNHNDILAEQFGQVQFDERTPESLNEPNFDDLLERELQLQKRLGQWLDAFQWPRTQLENTEPETASYLLMYYHVSFIWLSTRLNVTQTIFDEFTHHFREIVRHADIYLRTKALEKPAFTFEVGGVPPLYFVATKCRIPSIRRKALDLLKKAPRKECMWGAESVAELVCRVIEIEEEGLGHPSPDCSGRCSGATAFEDAVLPVEESRVHHLEILRNKETETFEVRVTRYSNVDGQLRRTIEDVPI